MHLSHYKAGSGYGMCLRSNTFNLLHGCLFYRDWRENRLHWHSVYRISFLETLGKIDKGGGQFSDRMLSGLWLIQWWFRTRLAAGDIESLVQSQTTAANIIFTMLYAYCYTMEWFCWFRMSHNKMRALSWKYKSKHIKATKNTADMLRNSCTHRTFKLKAPTNACAHSHM